MKPASQKWCTHVKSETYKYRQEEGKGWSVRYLAASQDAIFPSLNRSFSPLGHAKLYRLNRLHIVCNQQHRTCANSLSERSVRALHCMSKTLNRNASVGVKNSWRWTDFYLNMMLRAPRGVTSTAGANAYAAKLATSPRITAR